MEKQFIENNFYVSYKEKCDKTDQEILDITQKLIHNGLDEIELCNEGIVLILGNTGSGKSTLFNALGNKNLTSIKNKFRKNHFFIDVENCTKFKIGHENNKSETHVPNMIKIQDNVIFDCPGLEDTRGFEFDIANQFFISRIVNNAIKLKIILTISDQELYSTRGNAIKKILKSINKMFGNLDKLTDNMLLVFTKVNGYDKIDDYINDLKQQIIEQSDSDKKYREILSTLIDKNHIYFFRSPEQEGQIDKNDILNIVNILNKIEFSHDTKFSFSINVKYMDILINLKKSSDNYAGKLIEDMINCVKKCIENIRDKEYLSNIKGYLENSCEKFINNDKLFLEDFSSIVTSICVEKDEIFELMRLLKELINKLYVGFYKNFFSHGQKCIKIMCFFEIIFDIDMKLEILTNDNYERLSLIETRRLQYIGNINTMANNIDHEEENQKTQIIEFYKYKKSNKKIKQNTILEFFKVEKNIFKLLVPVCLIVNIYYYLIKK